MKYLLTGAQMKAMDGRSIRDYKIPSVVLMERAAMAVAREAEDLLEGIHGKAEGGKARKRGPVWAVCGPGNNGADGIAAARMLYLKGYEVSILLPKRSGHTTEEFTLQLAIAERLEIPVYTIEEFSPGECVLIIDALLGIGLSRELEGAYRDAVELMMAGRWEEGPASVVSVDIPSGVSSDTGAVMGCAVRADVTVTFGEEKLGQTLFPGRDFTGRLVVEDLGFVPETEAVRSTYFLAHERIDLGMIPRRPAYSNKGSFGRVLIAAGAPGMAGAAFFSAKAAYRAGAGLVKILTPEANRPVLGSLLPEAVLATYDSDNVQAFIAAGRVPEEFEMFLKAQAEWADVIVLGPGLGTEEYARVLMEIILENAYVPIILDADGLNLAAKHPELTRYFTENLILTPHLGEMARLTGRTVAEIRADLLGTAAGYARQFGVTCVLKDAATVIVRKDGKLFVNQSGSPAMAKGGSGDVLTGVIAALIALGMDECDASSLGVYVHGLAGELAAEKYGEHSVLAGELADCVGEIIAKNKK